MNAELPLSTRIHLGEVKQVRHYKHPVAYRIIGVAEHVNTGELLVFYISPQKLSWVRPLSEFDDVMEHEGKQVPRFVEVK